MQHLFLGIRLQLLLLLASNSNFSLDARYPSSHVSDMDSDLPWTPNKSHYVFLVNGQLISYTSESKTEMSLQVSFEDDHSHGGEKQSRV
jgi:hypothetical protein